jgi:hypothetical protein
VPKDDPTPGLSAGPAPEGRDQAVRMILPLREGGRAAAGRGRILLPIRSAVPKGDPTPGLSAGPAPEGRDQGCSA